MISLNSLLYQHHFSYNLHSFSFSMRVYISAMFSLPPTTDFSLKVFHDATLADPACSLIEYTNRRALRSKSLLRSISCCTASLFTRAVNVFTSGSQNASKFASTASAELGATPALNLRSAACASIL